jgi:hypothetical protein
MTHADARCWTSRHRCRRGGGDRGLLAARELLGHRRCLGGARDLEIIAALAQIDDAFVVRVFQNADEHAVAETFGIALQQLTCAKANVAGAHRLFARRHVVDRLANELERLGARQTLAARANTGIRRRRRTVLSGELQLRRPIGARRCRLSGTLFDSRRFIWRDCRRNSRLAHGDIFPRLTRSTILTIASAPATTTPTTTRSALFGNRRFARLAGHCNRLGTCWLRFTHRRSGGQVDFELAVLELGDGEQSALRRFLAEA